MELAFSRLLNVKKHSDENRHLVSPTSWHPLRGGEELTVWLEVNSSFLQTTAC